MKYLLLSIVLCLVVETYVNCRGLERKWQYPAILVPGIGGSRLETEFKIDNAVDSFCEESDGWEVLWLQAFYLAAKPQCFNSIFSLQFDPATGTTSNAEGVAVRVHDFGSTTGVEWLDEDQMFGAYMDGMVDTLVKEYGYERGTSLRAAPYDFRKAPNEQEEYFEALQKLVEETYEEQGEKQVVLIAHSMGCLYTLYFLNHQNQDWKDKYIKSFVSIAAPYGGSVKSLKLFVSGDNLDNENINASRIRDGQRSMPSSTFLMPYDTFWTKNEPLLVGPNGNSYSVKDYQEFFNDIEFPTGYEMRKITEPLIKDMKGPQVEVHCVYSSGEETIEKLTYADWTKEPEKTLGDGDGTVNIRSLKGCLKFKDKQSKEVHEFTVTGSDHSTILRNSDVLKYIGNVVTEPPSREGIGLIEAIVETADEVVDDVI